MNKLVKVIFLILILVCSGLSIAAFVMAIKKINSERFKKNFIKSHCKSEYNKGLQQCIADSEKDGTDPVECINQLANSLINSPYGCSSCADSMETCKSNPNNSEEKCIRDSLDQGCIRKIPCINTSNCKYRIN